jgi:hypothetical protein
MHQEIAVLFSVTSFYRVPVVHYTLPILWSGSNFFCGAAVLNRLLANIGNTIEARDEDGGWDGGRHFFLF